MNISKLRFDARLLVALNHISLLFIGILFFNFQRNISQILWAVGTALFLDICLRFLFKRKSLSIRNLLSPLVTGLSLVLLLNSGSIFVYVFSSGSSIISKYLLSFGQKHFFNPSLFGIVTSYCFFDFGSFSIQSNQFMGMSYSAIQLCLLGFFTLYFAKRLILPIFYYFTLIGGAFLFGCFQPSSDLVDLIGPDLSASGILFAFFMMTDPVTSPKTWKKKAIFSILCGLISLLLSAFQILHASFISLFIINSVNMLFIMNSGKNVRVAKELTFRRTENESSRGKLQGISWSLYSFLIRNKLRGIKSKTD